MRRQPLCDFQLNYDVNFVDQLGNFKKAVQYRRSNVIRQIAIEANAAACGNRCQIDFQYISGNNRKIGKFLTDLAQMSDQRRIEFHGVNRRAGGGQKFRHLAVAGANFDPAKWLSGRGYMFFGVARNVDGASDFFPPALAVQKMLSQPLPRHRFASVTATRSVYSGSPRKGSPSPSTICAAASR